MNVNRQASIDADELQQEPMAFSHAPQMMQQSESFPFNSESTLPTPYYYNLKRVQEICAHSIENFPQQDNQDFFVSYQRCLDGTKSPHLSVLWSNLL